MALKHHVIDDFAWSLPIIKTNILLSIIWSSTPKSHWPALRARAMEAAESGPRNIRTELKRPARAEPAILHTGVGPGHALFK